jgi:hypothetical protein
MVKGRRLMLKINAKHVMERRLFENEKLSKFILIKVIKIKPISVFLMLFYIGMEDGKKITFSGEGDQEPGLQPGDIVVVLDEKEHATFKRDKTDLHMKMPITLTEALCGFHKVIKTLDNRQLVVTALPGKIKQFEKQNIKIRNFYFR